MAMPDWRHQRRNHWNMILCITSTYNNTRYTIDINHLLTVAYIMISSFFTLKPWKALTNSADTHSLLTHNLHGRANLLPKCFRFLIFVGRQFHTEEVLPMVWIHGFSFVIQSHPHPQSNVPQHISMASFSCSKTHNRWIGRRSRSLNLKLWRKMLWTETNTTYSNWM